MINERISGAARATDRAQAAIRAAIRRIDHLSVNSLGVYMEPAEAQDQVMIAAQELRKICDALGRIVWPTDAEYDQV
jgi:hypothetical protein